MCPWLQHFNHQHNYPRMGHIHLSSPNPSLTCFIYLYLCTEDPTCNLCQLKAGQKSMETVCSQSQKVEVPKDLLVRHQEKLTLTVSSVTHHLQVSLFSLTGTQLQVSLETFRLLPLQMPHRSLQALCFVSVL